MHFSYSIGIDISRKYFDACVLVFKDHSVVTRAKFENNDKGFQAFISWLKKYTIVLKGSLFCMEATGVDSESLAEFLSKKGYAVWVGDPQSMNKAMSIERGKDDRLDAFKIAGFAIRFSDKYRAFVPLTDSVKELTKLFRLRNLLIKTEKQIKTYISSANSVENGLDSELISMLKPILEQKRATIKQIEKQIKEVMKQDESLWKCFKHAVSVKGVGFVTGVYLLICTRGFTRFDNVKELACYSGIVPFSHQSGTSLNRKSRVHQRSNKKLKSLLHMCALSAIQHDPELKAFYERRLAMGKHKMSELNVIRNKVLSRIWSCVKRERSYVPRPPKITEYEQQNRAA